MSNTDTIESIDYLLELDEQGVIVHRESGVILNNITEWLDTPRGSVFGKPSWGNELHKFKHETMNDDLAISVENLIIRGLIRDLPIFTSASTVTVRSDDFDRYAISIITPYGTISRLL